MDFVETADKLSKLVSDFPNLIRRRGAVDWWFQKQLWDLEVTMTKAVFILLTMASSIR